jgi:hypothetical protein
LTERTFDRVYVPQSPGRGRCPFCRKAQSTVKLQLWARRNGKAGESEKSLGSASRSMCEPCALELFEKFVAVIKR